jgi:hypothetical protein
MTGPSRRPSLRVRDFGASVACRSKSDVSRQQVVMHSPLSFPIHAAGALSQAVLGRGLADFIQLAEFVESLPYGRTTSTVDPLAVLRESCGTCSSKHHLLAAVAHECGHVEVQLTVGLYKMSADNTPGVGAVLRAASLPHVPEAHCYLTVAGERYDFTGLSQGSSSPFDSLLAEHFVSPAELWKTKIRIHKQVIASWSASVSVSAAAAWATREACIAALAANDSIERTSSGKLCLPAADAHVEH